MSYFDVFEELELVVSGNGHIAGCLDEWFEGMHLMDKLR